MSNPLRPMDYTVPEILQARILEWVAFPFSRGSSQHRDQTQVSCIAGRFSTSWDTREGQEYLSAYPIPSPGDLPNPGIEPESPTLEADSLPTELSGKPWYWACYWACYMASLVPQLVKSPSAMWETWVWSLARILGWVAIFFSIGSSWPRDQTHASCIGRRIFYHWVTWEAH